MPAARASAAKAPITLRDSTRVSVSNGNSFVAVKSGTSGGVLYAVGWHATNPDTAGASARAQRGMMDRGLAGEADRGAVDVAHLVRVSDRRELLLARVEGERLQDFGTRVEELLVELRHRGRMLDDDLGRERTRLHVAAFLEFEQVAAIAEDHALFELIENAHLRGSLTPASVSLGHDRREGRRRLIV